jgi:hypothetical protein
MPKILSARLVPPSLRNAEVYDMMFAGGRRVNNTMDEESVGGRWRFGSLARVKCKQRTCHFCILSHGRFTREDLW